MFKVLKVKKKLVITITFAIVAIVGGILIKTLPVFHSVHATIGMSQVSNIKDVIVDSSNVKANDTNEDLNEVSDTKNISDAQYNNDDINKQEIVSPELEKTTNHANKQETPSAQIKKTTNSNGANSQETVSAQIEKTSNNNDANNQETVSVQAEKPSNNTNKQETVTSQLKDTNSNVNTENQSNTNASSKVEKPTIHYDRTTSIYANDNITLLRVEYYANNKLTYYSVVEQFDAMTKSYIEKIYQCNRETNIDPLIRTDVYSNGNLIKSY